MTKQRSHKVETTCWVRGKQSVCLEITLHAEEISDPAACAQTDPVIIWMNSARTPE